MNIFFRFGVISFILFAVVDADPGNPLYESISSHFSKYRQLILYDDIKIENGIIHLEIKGRRTNIKSQLLLGFYSVGWALHKSSSSFREVHILIYYELKDGQELVARAPVDKVLDLSQVRLNKKQFLDIIEY